MESEDVVIIGSSGFQVSELNGGNYWPVIFVHVMVKLQLIVLFNQRVLR